MAKGKRTKTTSRASGKSATSKVITVKRANGLNSSQIKQNRQRLSVIIPASNEERTIGTVLMQVKRLCPKEIIVIVNGSRDRTLEICLAHDVTCYCYPFALGHDVGRAIGAREASGDVLLFLDGDIPLHPIHLQPFVDACYSGVDMALNNVNPFYTDSSKVDAVSMAKSYLNRMLLRPDLGFSSLTAIPHAMKKEAAERIGYKHLVVPPKAQTMAILQGLQVKHVHSVDVFRRNRIKSTNSGNGNLLEQLILGDHVEAVHYAQSIMSERLFFSDQLRQRHVLSQLDGAQKLSDEYFVLPAVAKQQN